MKKKILCLVTILITVVIFTTAYAIQYDDSIGSSLIQKGYSEVDIDEINALLMYSDAITVDQILDYYVVYNNDWDAVGDFFKINKEKHENYIKNMENFRAKVAGIPETVKKGMEAEGWTRSQLLELLNTHTIYNISYEEIWREYKSGKTLKDIQNEIINEQKKESELVTQFVLGEITTEEYENSLMKIKRTDNMTISELLSKTIELRTSVRARHKKKSGITEAEIAYCESQGMTNPMDMFQAKYFSKSNKMSFEKIVQVKLKHDDWISAGAELSGTPEDEYRMQIKKLQEAE